MMVIFIFSGLVCDNLFTVYIQINSKRQNTILVFTFFAGFTFFASNHRKCCIVLSSSRPSKVLISHRYLLYSFGNNNFRFGGTTYTLTLDTCIITVFSCSVFCGSIFFYVMRSMSEHNVVLWKALDSSHLQIIKLGKCLVLRSPIALDLKCRFLLSFHKVLTTMYKFFLLCHTSQKIYSYCYGFYSRSSISLGFS